MRNRFLAVLLCLCVVAALLPTTAFAATILSLNRTSKTLYVNENNKSNTATSYTFEVEALPSNYFCKWSVDDASIVDIASNTKNATVTAKKAGRTTLTCEVYSKTDTKEATLEATIVVNANAAAISIANVPEDNKIKVGTTFTFERVMTAANGGEATDKTEWSVSDESVGTIEKDSSSGVFTAVKTGTVEVYAKAYQSAATLELGYTAVSEPVVITVIDSSNSAPRLTAGTVNRASDANATVKFTSDEAGQYFFELVEKDAAAPNISTAGTGTACDITEQTISLVNLTAGAKDIYIVVKDAAEDLSSKTLKISIPAYEIPVVEGSAITEGANVLEKTANTSAAATVYYGRDSGGTPYAWRVIGYNGSGAAGESGEMTLISAKLLALCGFSSEGSSVYASSNLKAEVEKIAAGLSVKEQSAVTKRTLLTGRFDEENTDCVSRTEVPNALLWPLSTKEAYSMVLDLRVASPLNSDTPEYWWLRSAAYYANNPAAISKTGEGSYYSNEPESEYGVRPAFYLGLNTILLTSSAVGGKAAAGMDSGLTAVPENNPDKWKLTILDADRGFTAATTAYDSANEIVTVAYSGAATGENEYISAIVKDRGGNITHYGRLRKASSPADSFGTLEISLSGIMTAGAVLYIFNEQYNGGANDDTKLTDYASELVAVPLTKNAYAVTNSLTNISTGNPTPYRLISDTEPYSATLLVPDGYNLPAAITVEVGGRALISGYFYNSATGALAIDAASITGDIEVIALGLSSDFTLTPVKAVGVWQLTITGEVAAGDVILWAEYGENGRMLSCQPAANGDTRALPQGGNMVKAFWLGGDYSPKATSACFPTN